MGNNNKNLRKASKAKKDEFYTQLTDIEKELKHYKQHFKNKIVFCNCDDPEYSNFWKYFELNFEHLGLKKLIATHYCKNSISYKLELVKDINNDGKINKLDIIKTPLTGDGDFRSEECINILKEADIIITNPPFSLFKEFTAQLIEHNKKFIILGNTNALTYKETFSLLKKNKIWLGNTWNTMRFEVPNEDSYKDGWGYEIDDKGKTWRKFRNIRWFTNLDVKKRHEDIILYKKYNEKLYPKYDNYNAINVDKTKEIPMDYYGYMGVPITFMDKYNPTQFKLYGIMNTGEVNEGIRYKNTPHGRPVINGTEKYLRVLIKRVERKNL